MVNIVCRVNKGKEIKILRWEIERDDEKRQLTMRTKKDHHRERSAKKSTKRDLTSLRKK